MFEGFLRQCTKYLKFTSLRSNRWTNRQTKKQNLALSAQQKMLEIRYHFMSTSTPYMCQCVTVKRRKPSKEVTVPKPTARCYRKCHGTSGTTLRMPRVTEDVTR